jgi:signal transduction histidine kinase
MYNMFMIRLEPAGSQEGSGCWRKIFPRIQAYGLAILATGIAWLIDILLGNQFSHSSGGLYVMAAFVSTWVGGMGPGVLAVALTAAINLVFFDHPDLALAVGVHGFDPLIFFAVVAVSVSLIRRHQKMVSNLNFELEEKVAKRTAALNESNQQLEAFCYTLAHDLRAPLRAIQGFADLTITDYGAKLGRDGMAGVERIRNSAERMGRLIVDLLAYTNLTRADFRMQSVDLEKVWQSVLRMFADEIASKKAEVSNELAVKCVRGDPVGVERVLVNLLANALKFSHPDRAPRIRLFAESKSPNVRISIEDNGVGLEPRYRELIFGVFERLSLENTIGTGIGLAIVKRSVEKMGGKVGVESTPGAGSCFWFELAEAGPA